MLGNTSFLLYKNKIGKYIHGIVLVCLISPLCKVQAAPPESAYDFDTATWNMQGRSTARGDSKWTQVRAMLTASLSSNSDRRLEVLTLQESSELPADVEQIITSFPIITELQPGNNRISLDRNFNSQINAFTWNVGTRYRPNMVYVYQLSMNNRLNISIVSRYAANEIFVLPPNPPNSTTRRPVLGIRINQSAFFNVHAAAIGGGNEVPEHVISIENAMRNEPDVSTWMILGDYNRSPNSLATSIPFTNNPTNNHYTRQIVTNEEGRATQQSGNILDYAVIGASNYISRVLMVAHIMNIRSDHSAVIFSPCG